MTSKRISKISLFDSILPKMDCPLFGVTTVFIKKMHPFLQHYERIANNIQRRRFNEYHDDRSEMQTSDNPEELKAGLITWN